MKWYFYSEWAFHWQKNKINNNDFELKTKIATIKLDKNQICEHLLRLARQNDEQKRTTVKLAKKNIMKLAKKQNKSSFIVFTGTEQFLWT